MLLEYLKQLFLSPDKVSDHSSRIVGVIDDIVNKQKLVTFLESVYQEISPYDYEGIQFVLQQMSRIDPSCDTTKKRMAALDILFSYTRQVPPTLDELLQAKNGKRFCVDCIANRALLGLPEELEALLQVIHLA